MSRNYEAHHERYPWVADMQRRIAMQHNNEFDAFVRRQEALQAQCTCEYDGGYGYDGSVVKRFPKKGCPTHAEEDNDG